MDFYVALGIPKRYSQYPQRLPPHQDPRTRRHQRGAALKVMHVVWAVCKIMDHRRHYVGLQAANRVLSAYRFIGQQTQSDPSHLLSDVSLDHLDGIRVSNPALRDELLGAVEIGAVSPVVAEA